jgi:L-histidine N-alpha-methyltransferase
MAGAGTLERYLPMDVSELVVERCAEELVEMYPGLTVHGVVGDFEQHLEHVPDGRRRLVAFLGGTIGNFYPDTRAAFMRELRALMGDDGWLVLGTDLVKDVATLEAAYNDARGVTARFNLNMLDAINRELGADFDVGSFEHVAFWNETDSWIEMRLRAHGEQRVRIEAADLDVVLADGEEIRTEVSTKFTRERLEEELRGAGMELEAFFSDGLFGLTLAGPAR